MRRLLSVFSVGLLWVSTGHLQAQNVYPFIELTDRDLERIDLHDGSINDWLDTVGEPVLTGLDFIPHSFSVSYDPVDLDFRIWLAWHDATDRLYVAMERADDIYYNEFDRRRPWHQYMYYDSHLSFRVDGDGGEDPRPIDYGQTDVTWGSREHYLQIDRYSQVYNALAETFDDGPRLQLENYIFAPAGNHGDWYVRPPYAEGGGRHFGERPTITITEFYITPFDWFVWNDPSASQVSDLVPDKRINFLIVVNDYDRKREEGYTSDGSFWLGTRLWVDGLLFPAVSAANEEIVDQAEEPRKTRQADSWGRIKATFDLDHSTSKPIQTP